ncbi:MAG: FG-GAP-like repeat-containing protein [Candidatus Electryonea clarkiae]|nr:FG-GAP-like repeat-containing protein [Candidatus Electryonea clarkiae]MDP8286087.1 FG-GAP-like repeat-containing protein [Candidatus Electryonea clarkiae]
MNRSYSGLIFVLVFSWISSSIAQLEFTKHIISGEFDGAISIEVIDLDADDDLDLCGAASGSGEIAWWENDGALNFTEHTVDDDFSGAFDIIAVDLDDDGDIDIAAAARLAGEFAWWENDGSQDFTRHLISDLYSGPNAIDMADLDGDDDLDIVGAAFSSDLVIIFENDGNMVFTADTLAEMDGAYDVIAVDLDDDDDQDIAAIGNVSGTLYWWENEGDGDFQSNFIVGNIDGAFDIEAVDLDDDGDLDLAAAVTRIIGIPYWQNNGENRFNRHTITGNYGRMAAVAFGDVDLDGLTDAVGAAYEEDILVWYCASGGLAFDEYPLGNSMDFPRDIQISDLDGDEDMDIIACGMSSDEVAWWENDHYPSEFCLLTPDSGSVLDTTSISLIWEASSDPEGVDAINYDVYLSHDSLDLGEPVGTNIPGPFYTYMGDRSTRNWWTVKAVDNHTNGRWATERFSFWFGPTILPPDSFNLISPANQHIVMEEPVLFSWEKSNEHDAGDMVVYLIEMSTEFSFDEISIAYDAGSDTSLLIDHIPYGVFFWRVHAIDTNTDGRYSNNTWRIIQPNENETDYSIDINIPKDFEIISTYPVPFNNQAEINVSLPITGQLTLNVLNILGKEVRQITNNYFLEGNHKFYLNAEYLPSGIYLIHGTFNQKEDLLRTMLIK